MKVAVGWQFLLFATAEVLLYLSYQHHDSRFHWFLHFFVGSSAAFIVMTVITYPIEPFDSLFSGWSSAT